MSTFVISYMIKSDSTYASRYSSLVEQIRECSSKWEETTSFAVVSTAETLTALADRLYYKSLIISEKDILLVLDPNTGDAVIRGPVQYPNTLKSMLPKLAQK